VAVRARQVAGGGRSLIRVQLDIAPGFHVNANPASLDFLVPTRVLLAGRKPLQPRYPPPERLVAPWIDIPIAVWSGRVTIDVPLEGLAARPGEGHAEVPGKGSGSARAGSPVEGTVTVQACNEEICLAPSEIPFRAGPP